MISLLVCPEADMEQIARKHDFSKLSLPILVACKNDEQFHEFVFREGLMCSEVKRLQGKCEDLAKYPENKIVLLLPRWEEHRYTKDLADHWIFKLDRYTCQLRKPGVPVQRMSRMKTWMGVVAFCIVAWLIVGGFFTWLVAR